jgi:hypothetical protein
MEKLWVWLKTNWVVPFAAILVVISYFAGSQGKTSLKEMMRAQREDYEAQLKILEDKRAKEKKIMEDYKKSLQLLQEKHKMKEEEIKFENRAKLMETIKKNEEKPIEEIADDFAKRFNLERV